MRCFWFRSSLSSDPQPAISCPPCFSIMSYVGRKGMIARRSRLRYLGFGLRPTLTHPAAHKSPVARVTRSKMVNVGINILSFKPPLKWPKVQLVPLRLQWTGAEYHEGWLIPTREEIKGYMSIFFLNLPNTCFLQPVHNAVKCFS